MLLLTAASVLQQGPTSFAPSQSDSIMLASEGWHVQLSLKWAFLPLNFARHFLKVRLLTLQCAPKKRVKFVCFQRILIHLSPPPTSMNRSDQLPPPTSAPVPWPIRCMACCTPESLSPLSFPSANDQIALSLVHERLSPPFPKSCLGSVL